MERLQPYTDFEIQEQINSENLYYELKQNTMKTATIESCTLKGTWQTKKGDTMYTHTLTLSDGTTGDINAKSEMPDFLEVGKELNYASTSDKFGVKLTRIQPQDPDTPSRGAFSKGQNWEDPERQKKIIRQSSLAQAVAFFSGKQVGYEQVLTLAERFENWVNR